MPTTNHFGLPPKPAAHSPELAATVTRIDMIIAVFALGVILGTLIA